MPKLTPDPSERGLFKHPNGTYYVRKHVSGHGRLTKSLHTKNRHRAKVLMNQVLAEWFGQDPDTGKVLFETAAMEVLETKQSQSLKTFIDYETTLRLHLLPYFKGRDLSEVAGLWEPYKAHARRLTPERKLKHDRKHLRFILGYAYERGWVPGLPVLRLDRRDTIVKRGKEFSNEELDKLYARANPKWQLKIDLAFILGMRKNEIRLLKKSYINFTESVIHLPAEITKTREGRTIPFDAQLKRRLKAQMGLSSTEWIFPNAKDPQIPESEWQRTWQRIKRSVGVTGRFHDLRHTSATRAVRAGESPKIVQATHGMSNQVMDRVYIHASTEDSARISSSVRKSHRRKSSGKNREKGRFGAGISTRH